MIRIAIIGLGKIALDQHVPAIATNPDFHLVATAGGGRSGLAQDVPHYPDHHELLRAQGGQVDAVAICTPPGPRYVVAMDCLKAGLHVLLEKPPTSTLQELAALELLANEVQRTLFTAWHSQFAPAVTLLAESLRGEDVTRLRIVWHEDVRRWHPSQDWVFDVGGYGVFDPGINALSIATAVLPEPLIVTGCKMIIPAGRQSAIAAELTFDGDKSASFDWRTTGTQIWSISIGTASGRTIELSEGGSRLAIDDELQQLRNEGEYSGLYRRFATLVTGSRSEVDAQPLRIVADAFLIASRTLTEPFDWDAKA